MTMTTDAAAAQGEAAGKPVWSSQLGFILAAAGSAVGLGNIWKFPYMTGENGGGAFVLVYLGCIALVGIPALMTEMLVGRRGGHSPIQSVRDVVAEARAPRAWGWIGIISTLAAFLTLAFYSVVAGWAMPFVGHSIAGFDASDPEAVQALFPNLLAAPDQLLMWHTVFMVMTIFISARGINRGIEAAVKVMMPTLVLILMLLIGYSAVMNMDSLRQAVVFLFRPNFGALTTESTLSALGHAFFTLSLASGSMLAYGSYLSKSTPIVRTAVTVAAVDTAVALMAGLAIFPLVFQYGMEPAAGPGLVFATLPLAFAQMPGGDILGPVFFILLVIAAWTSSLSMIESVVEWLQEKGIGRTASAILAGGAAWALGILCLLSLNVMSGFAPLSFIPALEDKGMMDALDYIVTNVLMPLGALALAIFVGYIMPKDALRDELSTSARAFGIVRGMIRTITPIGILVIFLTNLI